MTTLYSILSHLNSINNNQQYRNTNLKFISVLPRSTVFKFIQLLWGIQVFLFTLKLYMSILVNKHPDTMEFDINEMWDCINDGWMRDYIYPYDDFLSNKPSAERVLRLGHNSFRPFFSVSFDENNEPQYNLKLDNNIQFNMDYVKYEHPTEQDLDDWYEEDHEDEGVTSL